MKEIFKKIIVFILIKEAQIVLRKYKPKIIAVTGSVGKTSTKDAIFSVLKEFFYVRKSEKSYNSEIGLPLTILGISNGWNNPFVWFLNILNGFWLIIWRHKYPEWLVLEVGVGKPGDMKRTASWLSTDIVIFTAMGNTPVHVEFFKSKDHLIEEKSGLIQTLKKDGILILNKDDEIVYNLKDKTKNQILTYGFDNNADIFGHQENIVYKNDEKNLSSFGTSFRVDIEGKSLPVLLEGVFGKNHIYATLAVFSVCALLKLNLLKAIDILKNFDVTPGRMRFLLGINDTMIIDDSYNASPYAMEAGLNTLQKLKIQGRKIGVLGDMLELGQHTNDAHEKIGNLAGSFLDYLFVVGPRSEFIKKGAIETGMKESKIKYFSNSKDAGEELKNFIKKGDMVLIKGSQGMRMERAVEAILLDQKNKKNLLVRQDKEWLDKK